MDGTQWKIEIKFNNHKKYFKSYGSNAYPCIDKKSKTISSKSLDNTPDFKKLLKILNKLINKKKYFFLKIRETIILYKSYLLHLLWTNVWILKINSKSNTYKCLQMTYILVIIILVICFVYLWVICYALTKIPQKSQCRNLFFFCPTLFCQRSLAHFAFFPIEIQCKKCKKS